MLQTVLSIRRQAFTDAPFPPPYSPLSCAKKLSTDNAKKLLLLLLLLAALLMSFWLLSESA